MSFCNSARADHSSATAPATWGVAIDVPVRVPYASSDVFTLERVCVPGAVILGFMRLL